MVISVPIPQYAMLDIIYAPQDGMGEAVKTQIMIQDGITFQDIGTKITIQPGKFLYATVKNGGIQQRLEEKSSCIDVAGKDSEIHAFQCMNGDEKEEEKVMDPKGGKSKVSNDMYLLEIRVSQVDRYSCYTPKLVPTKRPLVFYIPVNMSIHNLRLFIFRKLLPFTKEAPGKDVEKTYEHYFSPGKKVPYNLNIVFNAPTSQYVYLRPMCEFCDRRHDGDCSLDFKDEKNIPFFKLLDALKPSRDLVLNLVLNSECPLMAIEKLTKQLNLCIIGKGDAVAKKGVTLYDCLDSFSKEEQLDQTNLWHCSKCSKEVRAVKHMTLCRLPPILVIHLKRFKQKTVSSWVTQKKIEEFVDYPVENLDLSKYVESPGKEKVLYNLFGVTHHYGALGGGHYTAVCKYLPENLWVLYDDTALYKAAKDEIVAKTGYVLYYRNAELDKGGAY